MPVSQKSSLPTIASDGVGSLRTARRVLAAASLCFLAWLPPALAQTINCGGLQAQIARAGQSNDNAGRYLAAANRQRGELVRTQAYAQSIGCDRRQFLFFGSPPPAQCGPLEQRIATMQGNLANLQAQVQMASGGRAQLIAQYNAYCRNQVAVQQPRSFFEQLFGGGPQYEQMPGNALPDDDMPGDEQRPRGGGSTAICVRTCDGGFFPVSYSAGSRDLNSFADLCKALCPNAETEVYRFTNGGNIEDAVNDVGASYTSLANASKFKKTYDPTCSCKPPGKSWAEALDGAEKLLGSRRNDLIVTPEKSEELSRPRAPRGTQAAANPRNAPQPQPQAQPQASSLSAIQETEKQDAAIGENAPTAGSASAGIEGGRATRGSVYGITDGARQQSKDAQGNNRRVRVIDPSL